MSAAAVAYIALLASRLPWFLGGAAPAAAGAGFTMVFVHYCYVKINYLKLALLSRTIILRCTSLVVIAAADGFRLEADLQQLLVVEDLPAVEDPGRLVHLAVDFFVREVLGNKGIAIICSASCCRCARRGGPGKQCNNCCFRACV